MTRLDRITMQGFKSFAGKTAIPFPAGFNCVCGPNGAGKSNIIDALTFVLGTSSARSIRAQKLQNLIFNGGADRKPADYCEVTLYLDNRDRKVPLTDDEVKVTRRVTRSGISVYKLNGRSVTRNKIVDLMSSIGLSPDGYNIIMQGDVTKIIEMSTQERREVIDDVSGISEFDEKREKATREMERVELRVRESMIVAAEKQKFVQRLKAEKENAEKYVSLNERLRIHRASLLRRKLEEAEEKLAVIENESGVKSGELEDKSGLFSGAEKELEGRERDVKKVDAEILQKTKNMDMLRRTDAMQAEILRKRDKIDFNMRETARLREFMAPERNEAVREILGLKMKGVYNTVESVINAPKDYAVAIEVAVGRHSKDIIVDGEETATGCIKHLKSRRIGRARFLPLERMRKRNRQEYRGRENIIGYAIDLIKFDRKFLPAMEYVLGSTLVVDSVDTAKKIRGFRVVTLDGDMMEPSGAMIGGFYRKRKPDVSARLKEIEDENDNLEAEIGALEKDVAKHKVREESEKPAQLREERERLEKEIEALRKKWKSLFEEKMLLQNAINRLKIDGARLEAGRDSLRLELEEFRDVQERESGSVEELQEKVRYFVVEINRLGPVNMKAIEEFKTINVEFEEMKKNLDRLLEEKEAIVKIADDIEKRRYGKFMETFGEIAGNFSTIYHDMTGGSGMLRLEEENNISSGLVLEANPSGKKVLNLDSMSGGEKTLTSLSFLFAIMQHYSAPFYVLDEIDAALDKANTKKIADLIKKYSKSVQFVVISHNDLTIGEADRVFGVSMENGVSKILGIEMPGE